MAETQAERMGASWLCTLLHRRQDTGISLQLQPHVILQFLYVVRQWLCSEAIAASLWREREKIRGGSIIGPSHNFDQLVFTHRMEKLGFWVSACCLTMWLNGSHQRGKQWRVRFWMNYRIIAEAFRCGVMQHWLGYGGRRGRRVGGFLVRGKLDLGYILWQIHCLVKLMIRVCLVACRSACVFPSYHLTCCRLFPVRAATTVSKEQI